MEAVLYWLGNPIIYDRFDWHYIPELGMTLFLGVWMKEAGFGWWVIPVLFVATSITVIIIWSAPDRPIVVIALSIAMAFALIGYYVRKPKAESARAG